MRRSATITLTLLAGAGLGLAYCHGDSDTEGVLETQAACIDRLGPDTAAECEDVFQSARQAHAATAPRFASSEACQASTGTDCMPAAASVFIPVMAGVMIGRALSDGTRGATPVYAGGVPPVCLPGGQGGPDCPTSGAASSGTSSSRSGGGGGRYWYSGNSYVGASTAAGQAGFSRTTPSAAGAAVLSRGTGSSAGHAGVSGSRSGGFGFSAASHGGGGS